MFLTSSATRGQRARRALVVVFLAGIAFDACDGEKPQAAPPGPVSSPVIAPESAPVTPAPAPQSAKPAPPRTPSVPAWKTVTLQLIDDKIDFKKLPSDSGVFTPIARSDDQPDQEVLDQLVLLSAALQTWRPGNVADPVQRVRNYLYIPATADVFQLPTEAYIPSIVFDHLRQTVPQDDLIKILYWIAAHAEGGDDKALDELTAVGLPSAPGGPDEIRNRAGYYAAKLLGRLIGRISAQ